MSQPDAAEPPEDAEQCAVIDKLAQFVARNGPEFEKMTKEKQQGNPQFAFLFGGDYSGYYLSKVEEIRKTLASQPPIPHQQHQPPPRSDSAGPPVSYQLKTSFTPIAELRFIDTSIINYHYVIQSLYILFLYSTVFLFSLIGVDHPTVVVGTSEVLVVKGTGVEATGPLLTVTGAVPVGPLAAEEEVHGVQAPTPLRHRTKVAHTTPRLLTLHTLLLPS